LHPINFKATGRETTGQPRFDLMRETLVIHVDVSAAPPDIEHWQHCHGFKDDRKATCPTDAADVNHGGIIDITETESVSGVTMVAFNADPASMQVVTDSYPKASSDGALRYERTVPLKTLRGAFANVRGSEPRSRPAGRVRARCGSDIETAGNGGLAGHDSSARHAAHCVRRD
jgi:hypothetical protein